jgi:hypothetical protein
MAIWARPNQSESVIEGAAPGLADFLLATGHVADVPGLIEWRSFIVRGAALGRWAAFSEQFFNLSGSFSLFSLDTFAGHSGFATFDLHTF